MCKFFFAILLLFLVMSCSEQTCLCDQTFVSENKETIQKAMHDSSLLNLDSRYNQDRLLLKKSESYRIYISHSLNRYFQVYTLSKEDNGANLFVQEYVGPSGYSLDNKLDKSYRIKLTENDWLNIKNSVEDNCFWTIRLDDGKRNFKLEGGEIILQGYQPGKRNCANTDFHLVVDWASKDPRLYKIVDQIRKHAKEQQLHVL